MAPRSFVLHPEFTGLSWPPPCCVCHSLVLAALAPPFFCFLAAFDCLGQLVLACGPKQYEHW